jgi:predicted DNA-binding WGR domain protein
LEVLTWRNDSGLTDHYLRQSSTLPAISRKFWDILIDGKVFTVRFGRIGTLGQSQTKSFADEAQAQREGEALIAEKLKKGYTEKRS